MKNLSIAAACLLFALAASAPVAAQTDAGYRIGASDLLRITVWNEPELSGTVPVRPDGMISLPLLNDVHAAGLTPLQLRENLIDRLRHYMPAPEVSVIVEEVRSQTASVMGHVREPGVYDLRGSTTVIELIAMAGGFTEFAKPGRIVILRNDGEVSRQIKFNYFNAVSRRGGANDNIVLKTGDVVVVN